MKTLLKNARCVVTCDDADRVLRGADVLMEDGVISKIGDLGGLATDEVIDASRLILYPGLINTHHHLYQYFTRNLRHVQNLELFDWLTALYDIWAYLNADTVRLSSLSGMGELMKYGCTTCFDHHYVFPQGAGDLLGAQFAAAEALGIRMVSSRGSMSLSRKDGGLPPDSVVQSVDEILHDSREAIERYHDASDYSMRQVVLAPCSPFSVTGDLMKQSAALARSYGVKLHTHLCETKDEERFTETTRGMRPLAYMESVDFVGSDVFYAHGIYFNDEELQFLADTGTGVAHCPCSNMKLSSGVARIPDMLRLGVPVGLAVDGSASNDASNLMEEMRAAYLMHRLRYGADAPGGYELLKLATRGSARLLGREKLGQIAEGCAADLFAIRYDRLEMTGAERDEMNLFGTVGYHLPADAVWVGGRQTVKDGALLTIDEERTAFESRAEVERLLTAGMAN
ncbi:MAG: 8-oxoguanine deaminase [Clostridiales bacterium]|nr:8-oxoguanine deaminase [Clostridiales bacterium]